MWKDVAKRPFITAGFTAFVLMIPLAVTSTTGWIRRMGGKRWQLLHRLVYFSGIAAVVHYYWLVKSDIRSACDVRSLRRGAAALSRRGLAGQAAGI